MQTNNKIIQLGNLVKREKNFSNPQVGRVYSPDGLCACINTFGGGQREFKILIKDKDGKYKIRKITPNECFRLMGFSDLDFFSAKLGNKLIAQKFLNKNPKATKERYMLSEENKSISNSQLYKMAGNSIAVNVLHSIYDSLYKAMPYLFDNLTVGSFFSGIGAFEKALDEFYKDKA